MLAGLLLNLTEPVTSSGGGIIAVPSTERLATYRDRLKASAVGEVFEEIEQLDEAVASHVVEKTAAVVSPDADLDFSVLLRLSELASLLEYTEWRLQVLMQQAAYDAQREAAYLEALALEALRIRDDEDAILVLMM